MFNRKSKKIAELDQQLSEIKMTNGLLAEENSKLFKENRELKGKLKIYEIKCGTWTGITYSEVSRCIYKKGGEVVASDIGREAAAFLIDLIWKQENLRTALFVEEQKKVG